MVEGERGEGRRRGRGKEPTRKERESEEGEFEEANFMPSPVFGPFAGFALFVNAGQ